MPYFHVVFTVPSQVEVIAFQNQTVVYDILFRAASETLRTARSPGSREACHQFRSRDSESDVPPHHH